MAERTEQDKIVRFIAKLVQLTQEKKIEWSAASSQGPDAAFVGEVDGRRLRLYRYSEKVPNPAYADYTNPFSTSSSSISGILFPQRGVPPETVQRSGVVLEVSDDMDRPVYKFDNSTGLSALYESAAYSAGKVDDLMNSVLAKE